MRSGLALCLAGAASFVLQVPLELTVPTEAVGSHAPDCAGQVSRLEALCWRLRVRGGRLRCGRQLARDTAPNRHQRLSRVRVRVGVGVGVGVMVGLW